MMSTKYRNETEVSPNFSAQFSFPQSQVTCLPGSNGLQSTHSGAKTDKLPNALIVGRFANFAKLARKTHNQTAAQGFNTLL